MGLVIGIIIIAVLYLIVYGVMKIIATIAVALKLPWLVVVITWIGIIGYLRSNSFLNYVAVGVSAVAIALLIFQQIILILQVKEGSGRVNRSDYQSNLRKMYANLYTFLAFSTLYANFNYIVYEMISGGDWSAAQAEYGPFAGIAISMTGLSPIKWGILLLAIIPLVRFFSKLKDFNIESGYHPTTQKPQGQSQAKTQPLQPLSPTHEYFTKVLGLPSDLSQGTGEKIHHALSDYFAAELQGETEKAERLTEAVLDAMAFDIVNTEELKETLASNSGLSNDEIKNCIPKLRDAM